MNYFFSPPFPFNPQKEATFSGKEPQTLKLNLLQQIKTGSVWRKKKKHHHKGGHCSVGLKANPINQAGHQLYNSKQAPGLLEIGSVMDVKSYFIVIISNGEKQQPSFPQTSNYGLHGL